MNPDLDSHQHEATRKRKFEPELGVVDGRSGHALSRHQASSTAVNR